MTSSNNPNFLIQNAALRRPVERTPVWLMRQAGRYQKEFREIRKKVDFLTLCRTPELVVEVSLLPIQQFGMDGAIIFSDLLIPCEAMGSDLEYVKGTGPVIHNPVKSMADIEKLIEPDPAEASSSLGEGIRLLRKEVEPAIPVLGFTGAPWTTAAYMVEGGGSRNYVDMKTMMYQAPDLFDALMQKVTRVLISYLKYQAEAGVAMVQIFDSWAGCLSADDYRKYALPYTKDVIQGFKAAYPELPLVLYVGNSGHFLSDTVDSGADVLSLDWRVDMVKAYQAYGDKVAFQGNIDPCLLFGTAEQVVEATENLLRSFPGDTGHIFNLGHGILPKTPPENVKALVDTVKSFKG